MEEAWNLMIQCLEIVRLSIRVPMLGSTVFLGHLASVKDRIV